MFPTETCSLRAQSKTQLENALPAPEMTTTKELSAQGQGAELLLLWGVQPPPCVDEVSLSEWTAFLLCAPWAGGGGGQITFVFEQCPYLPVLPLHGGCFFRLSAQVPAL